MKNILTKMAGRLKLARNFLGRVRWIKKIIKLHVPPGHYYSPIPSIEEVLLRENEIFNFRSKEIPGIDLNEEEQINLFNKLKDFYNELPFESIKKGALRFYFGNGYFDHQDAIILYCMIRYLRPKKIIEVGSGFSSCIILDINELFFDNTISCTFIEPYPKRLHSLIKKSDSDRNNIIQRKLQDVDMSKFTELNAGDVLFIDSTHVSKIGSDVNYIFFKVIPLIKKGVYIHFHDIFYPFEYPKKWVCEQGKAWNEAYLLRAFLQYNNEYKIQIFNDFFERFHKDRLTNGMPKCIKNSGSIWIKKV